MTDKRQELRDYVAAEAKKLRASRDALGLESAEQHCKGLRKLVEDMGQRSRETRELLRPAASRIRMMGNKTGE